MNKVHNRHDCHGTKLADGDGKHSAKHGFVHVGHKFYCAKKSNSQFDNLFHNGCDTARRHVHVALEVALQNVCDGHENKGRRNHQKCRGSFPIALCVGNEIGKQTHCNGACQTCGKQKHKGHGKHLAPLVFKSKLMLFGNQFGKRNGNTCLRQSEKQNVGRKNKLVQPHAVATNNVGEWNAVQRTQNFCNQTTDTQDKRTCQQIVLFHSIYSMFDCL